MVNSKQVKNQSNILLNFLVYSLCLILVSVTVLSIYKLNVDRTKLATYHPDEYSYERKIKDLECLAINIYKEAGYEPFEGKVAVAQVTMNRVNHPDFPQDVCQVVYQKNIAYKKVVCQFSWYCDKVHRNRPVNPVAYNESYEVAKKVLLEDFRLSGLEAALFYHADYVNPRWKLEKVVQIGRHIFYKQFDNS